MISSAILAGAIASPAMYVIRFILKGRGHDDTEFQEAQAALGLSYSGHFLDWFFIGLTGTITAIWFAKCKPGYTIAGRILAGTILTFIFLVVLQKVNNAIFDPLLQPK